MHIDAQLVFVQLWEKRKKDWKVKLFNKESCHLGHFIFRRRRTLNMFERAWDFVWLKSLLTETYSSSVCVSFLSDRGFCAYNVPTPAWKFIIDNSKLESMISGGENKPISQYLAQCFPSWLHQTNFHA